MPWSSTDSPYRKSRVRTYIAGEQSSCVCTQVCTVHTRACAVEHMPRLGAPISRRGRNRLPAPHARHPTSTWRGRNKKEREKERAYPAQPFADEGSTALARFGLPVRLVVTAMIGGRRRGAHWRCTLSHDALGGFLRLDDSDGGKRGGKRPPFRDADRRRSVPWDEFASLLHSLPPSSPFSRARLGALFRYQFFPSLPGTKDSSLVCSAGRQGNGERTSCFSRTVLAGLVGLGPLAESSSQ